MTVLSVSDTEGATEALRGLFSSSLSSTPSESIAEDTPESQVPIPAKETAEFPYSYPVQVIESQSLPNQRSYEWTEDEWGRIGYIYDLIPPDYMSLLSEFGSYHIPLPSDPLAVGLGVFHELLSTIQAYKDRVSHVMADILVTKVTWATALNRVEGIYKRKKAYYLLQDDVKLLRNTDMQTASCEIKMPHVVELMNFVDEALQYIDNIVKVIREIQVNLESTNSNLSRQVTVIDQQIKVGGLDNATGSLSGNLTLTNRRNE